jgi:hypothetical protein
MRLEQRAQEALAMKTFVTVSVVAGCVLTLATVVPAAEPTQSDYDACNRAAQAASSPSAAPSKGTTGPTITTPSGTPDATGGVQPGGSASKTGPMVTGSGRTPGSAGGVSEGTGAVSKDATGLTGMAAEGMKDPVFKAAFQDCMKQRGF